MCLSAVNRGQVVRLASSGASSGTMGTVVVITGGTGGIGFQVALAIAKADPANTVIVTGRSEISGNEAVGKIKTESGNGNVHLALGDMALQKAVRAMAADLHQSFPAIDVLVNNAGTLEYNTTADGVSETFAVNVIAPLLLTRLLVPALKAASPPGNVQITSGGTPFDFVHLDDLQGVKITGIENYSHSKRVMEPMSLALEAELSPHGIALNVAGGGNPGATKMTQSVAFGDMPWYAKCLYPLWRIATAPDKGKSAAVAARPVIWAVQASPEELGLP